MKCHPEKILLVSDEQNLIRKIMQAVPHDDIKEQIIDIPYHFKITKETLFEDAMLLAEREDAANKTSLVILGGFVSLMALGQKILLKDDFVWFQNTYSKRTKQYTKIILISSDQTTTFTESILEEISLKYEVISEKSAREVAQRVFFIIFSLIGSRRRLK